MAASVLRLTPSCRARAASLRCRDFGSRSRNLPLYAVSVRGGGISRTSSRAVSIHATLHSSIAAVALSTVSPWAMQPGRSSISATYPPSSAGCSVIGYRRERRERRSRRPSLLVLFGAFMFLLQIERLGQALHVELLHPLTFHCGDTEWVGALLVKDAMALGFAAFLSNRAPSSAGVSLPHVWCPDCSGIAQSDSCVETRMDDTMGNITCQCREVRRSSWSQREWGLQPSKARHRLLRIAEWS